MKILHVIDSAGDDRQIRHIVNGAEAWRRHGHERQLATLDPPSAPWLADAGLEIFPLGVDGMHMSFKSFGFTPRLVPWLKKCASRYDAVIIDGLRNFSALGVWRALRGGRTPYFVFVDGALEPQTNLPRPWDQKAREFYWRAIESRVLRDARAALFSCEDEKRRATEAFSPIRARACVVGHGARAPDFAPERQIPAFFQQTPRVAGRFFALYLGRIHESASVDRLIDGFSLIAPSFPQLDLVIAGSGRPGLVEALRRRAAARGFGDRIHWPGLLGEDAKWGALHAARFFVLPSHHENFSLAVAEALAAATPVLVNDQVDMCRDIIADGAGQAAADTLPGLAQGLRMMAELPPDRHLDMAARARACFCARYDLDLVAMGLHDRLTQYCAENRAPTPQPFVGEILSSPPI